MAPVSFVARPGVEVSLGNAKLPHPSDNAFDAEDKTSVTLGTCLQPAWQRGLLFSHFKRPLI